MRVGRQQWRRWVDLIQKLQNRERLRDGRVRLPGLGVNQCRNGPQRVDFEKRLAALLAGVQIDIALMRLHALEVERHAHAVSSGGAPEREKLETGCIGHVDFLMMGADEIARLPRFKAMRCTVPAAIHATA